MRIWWVLASAGAFGTVEACGGSSVDRREGSGASAGDGNGGTSTGGTSGGGTSAGGTRAGGSSGVGGTLDPCADKPCGSVCGYCAQNDPQCNGATGEKFCDAEGSCTTSHPTCPEPTCTSALQCPYPQSLCITCENGEIVCATRTCVDGVCGLARPVCPECRTDTDCPPLPIECTTCADGTTSCPSFECHGGRCLTRFGCSDPCAGRACGEVCNPCKGSDCPSAELLTCNLEGACSGGNPACMGTCENTSDCPTPPPDCIACVDGDCAQMTCISGVCELICNRRQPCDAVSDCDPTLECLVCPDESCADHACIDGGCQRLCPLAR